MTSAPHLAIVDDDADYSVFLQTLLSTRGYDVTAYPSGTAFLDSLEREPLPDLVLLDVMMPGLDGLATLRATRDAAPQLPIIMLSGQETAGIIVDAVRAGAADYIVKPVAIDQWDGQDLQSVIASTLARQGADTPAARPEPIEAGSDDRGPCWADSPAMRPVLTMIERVADSDVSVLLTGESGVGKEVIARELHRRSARRNRHFVKVNCAAMPSELLESELFGHERGAFTGAHAPRIGKFEFANGGTLMLDEIGEMPPLLQAKLLHVLQDNTFTKLGSNRIISVDVRIVAATNRSLVEMIEAGAFREDLYYRLQVIEIHVPPLRERQSEILPLAEYFLSLHGGRIGRRLPRPSPRLREALLAYPWPGNVRELENMIKRFVVLQDEAMILGELQARPRLTPHTRPLAAAARPGSGVAPPPGIPVPGSGAVDVAGPLADHSSLPALAREASREAERVAIQRALEQFRWNRRKAARQLGVSYKTLLNKMKECGITRGDTADEGV